MKHLMILIVFCAAGLAMQGCATGSGLGGTTKYEMSFSDRQGLVDPETGENTGAMGDTGFQVKASGKAGDVIQSVAKMGYTWNTDGGTISVASDSSLDATARAQALTEFYAIQAQNFAQFTALLQMGMSVAAPLIGQNLDLNAAQRQIDSADDMAIRQQLVPMLEGLFGRLETSQNADRGRMTDIESRLQALIEQLGGLPNVTPPVVTEP